MKVLFIGNFLERTGWGIAGANYLGALNTIKGLEVAARHISFGATINEPPEYIKRMMDTDGSDAEVVIYNVLPHLIEYDARFKKNIALFYSETYSFMDSCWNKQLCMMDEVWVASNQQSEALMNSKADCFLKGRIVPLHVVPIPCDVSRYDQSLNKFPLPIDPEDFVFYGVGEFTARKNWGALIRAFHTEFDRKEPVQLLLKCHKPGLNPTDSTKLVGDFCEMTKGGLKLYGDINAYKRELIMSESIPDDKLLELHKAGSCYVSTSYGEAMNLAMVDAAGIGNPVIVTKTGGMSDFVGPDRNGWAVKARREPVHAAIDTFTNLYTGYEDWDSIDVKELMMAMRFVYENVEGREKMVTNAKQKVQSMSYEQMGKKIAKLLEV